MPEVGPRREGLVRAALVPSGAAGAVDMPGIAEHEVERAAAKAKEVALAVIAGGYVPTEALDTVNDWYKRYYEFAERGEVGRKNRGQPQVTAKDRAARFWKWISPVIGTRPMALVGPDDLRAVVRKLDEQIRIAPPALRAAPRAGRTRGDAPGSPRRRRRTSGAR